MPVIRRIALRFMESLDKESHMKWVLSHETEKSPWQAPASFSFTRQELTDLLKKLEEAAYLEGSADGKRELQRGLRSLLDAAGTHTHNPRYK